MSAVVVSTLFSFAVTGAQILAGAVKFYIVNLYIEKTVAIFYIIHFSFNRIKEIFNYFLKFHALLPAALL